MKFLVQCVAAWAGVNALFFFALSYVALQRQSEATGVATAAALFGLGSFGAIVSALLWSNRQKGRVVGLLFFGILMFAYAVKLAIGPERALLILPLGLTMSALGVLVATKRNGVIPMRE